MSGNKQALPGLISSLPEDVNLVDLEAAAQKLVSANLTMRFNFGNAPFDRDFSKEGFDLESDVEPLTGELDLDVVSFTKEGETPISGEEMIKRSIQLGGHHSQRDAEKLLKENAKIPKEFRNFHLVFTGTVWFGRRTRERYVPYLHWKVDRCYMHLSGLGNAWYPRVRLLVPRKK